MATLSALDRVAFPEISPSLADQVDAMLARLVGVQWGEAACQSRRLVRATAEGDAATLRELRRSARLLDSDRRIRW